MGYADALKRHLAEYKRSELGVKENGLWKTQDRPYPHILPEAELRKNILATIRDDFWGWPECPKLHRDFHHLNSSQAMCFNLFFPFLNYGPERAAELLDALGVPVEPIAAWAFEKIPDPEEATNLDLWLQLESDRQIFFELKLTESEFGAPKPNEKRSEKYAELYRPRLEGRVANALIDTEEEFFKRYQLMRNLWHLDAERDDLLFLIFPHGNRKLVEQADSFCGELEAAWRARVTAIRLEALHERLSERAKGDGSLERHLAAFATKYLPADH